MTRRCVLLTTSLKLGLVAPIHAQPKPPAVPDGVKVVRDVPYVEQGHERQKLDLYLPDQKATTPLVVFIHGGGFAKGSKKR